MEVINANCLATGVDFSFLVGIPLKKKCCTESLNKSKVNNHIHIACGMFLGPLTGKEGTCLAQRGR